jgi:hypothetical protein
MSLVQIFVVEDDMTLSSKIISQELFAGEKAKWKLDDPLTFSFHPFPAAVYLSPSIKADDPIKKFFSISLKLLIVDEEDKASVFRNISPSNSLVLIAEIIRSMDEAFTLLWLELIELSIKEDYLHITISFKGLKRTADIIYKMTLFRVALESLLFVRGMTQSDCTVLVMGEEENIDMQKYQRILVGAWK